MYNFPTKNNADSSNLGLIHQAFAFSTSHILTKQFSLRIQNPENKAENFFEAVCEVRQNLFHENGGQVAVS